jgi:hypothetical protein
MVAGFRRSPRVWGSVFWCDLQRVIPKPLGRDQYALLVNDGQHRHLDMME